jgi:hypothetical protein
MWPFTKKSSAAQPSVISSDGIQARYNPRLKLWSFHFAGMDFNVSQIEFDVRAFGWAAEAAATVNLMRPRMMPVVAKWLEGWPCDHSTAHILSVELSKYGDSKTMDVDFIGDDSWGDFGVTVVIRDGEIVDSYAGD